MNVDLIQQTGVHLATRQTIFLPQFSIFVDGVEVGIIGDRLAASVSLFEEQPLGVREAIEAAVIRRGRRVTQFSWPPPVSAVVDDEEE